MVKRAKNIVDKIKSLSLKSDIYVNNNFKLICHAIKCVMLFHHKGIPGNIVREVLPDNSNSNTIL